MKISFAEAVRALQNGQVIAVPTETVYGLAASLSHEIAIKQIFSLKGRPSSNPLIIHVSDIDQITKYTTQFPPFFNELAETFWPGPMTLVIPVQSQAIFPLVRAGLPTAGFRIPNHELTLKLLQATGPLVMPSANLSGKPSSTTPHHVEEDFGAQFPVLDGGHCQKGVESTILYYQEGEWVILRLGSLEPEAFEKVLGYQPQVVLADASKPLCPGQSFRHYAPKAQLLLGDASEAAYILGFKERSYPIQKRVIYMGSLGRPEEVAENLYKVLRQLDQEGAETVWVDMNFPSHGLWRTIAERLQRASDRE